MNTGIKTAIRDQRNFLKEALLERLDSYATKLAPCMADQQQLLQHLEGIFNELKDSKYLYGLNESGVQITPNLSRDGLDVSQLGRDRSLRPYMAGMFGKTNFRLSKAYISKNTRRASLTAVQKIRDEEGRRLGFLGIDYDLRELTQDEDIYTEIHQWQQIKCDPSIRANLFTQSRVQSEMDDNLDDV